MSSVHTDMKGKYVIMNVDPKMLNIAVMQLHYVASQYSYELYTDGIRLAEKEDWDALKRQMDKHPLVDPFSLQGIQSLAGAIYKCLSLLRKHSVLVNRWGPVEEDFVHQICSIAASMAANAAKQPQEGPKRDGTDFSPPDPS